MIVLRINSAYKEANKMWLVLLLAPSEEKLAKQLVELGSRPCSSRSSATRLSRSAGVCNEIVEIFSVRDQQTVLCAYPVTL